MYNNHWSYLSNRSSVILVIILVCVDIYLNMNHLK